MVAQAIDPMQLQAWLAQVQMMNDRQATRQAGRSERANLAMLMQLLGSASAKELAANQANEMRYQDILELLGLNRRDQIGMVDQYGQSARDDLNRRWDVNTRNSLSDLSSRGLGGSTVADSIRAVNTRERGAELRRLEDELLRNRMDVRDRTLSPITGVMERRSDVGPDLNSVNALAGMVGSSGLVGTGGGLRPTVGSIRPGAYSGSVATTGPESFWPGGQPPWANQSLNAPLTSALRGDAPHVGSSFAGRPAAPWLYANAATPQPQQLLAGDRPMRGVAGDAGFYPSGSDPTRTNPFTAYFGGSKPIGWADRGANFSVVENWQAANNGPVQMARPILGGPMVNGFGPFVTGGSGYRPIRPVIPGTNTQLKSPYQRRPIARQPLISQVVTPPRYEQAIPYAYA